MRPDTWRLNLRNYPVKRELLPDNDFRMKTALPILAGVTIHDTANKKPGTGAEWHARYMKTEHCRNRKASWHYSVDDMLVVQSLPLDVRGLHAGNKAGNDRTIGIEICVNSDSNLLAATEKAAELTADILFDSNLTAENVYRHIDWTGKICPAEIIAGRPYDWKTFLDRVDHYLDEWGQPEKPIKKESEPVTKNETLLKKIINTIKEIANAIKKNSDPGI